MKLHKLSIKGRTDLILAEHFDYVVIDVNKSGQAMGYFFDEQIADLFIDGVNRSQKDEEAINIIRRAADYFSPKLPKKGKSRCLKN